MTEPFHHICDSFNNVSVRHKRPVNQNNRQTQRARSVQFGPRAASASIFRNDKADTVGSQQGKVAVIGEGAARDNDGHIWQRQGLDRRIDKAQKVVMPGGYGEIFKLLPTDGKKDAGRLHRQDGDGGSHVGDQHPLIGGTGLPGRTLQRQKGNAGDFGSLHRVTAHLGGKGVGRVDDMGDVFGAQIGHKPCHTAKATDPAGQRLRHGRIGPPGVRENARNALICHGFGKIRGFAGASQKKGAGHG